MSSNIDIEKIKAELAEAFEEEIYDFRLQGEGSCRLSPFSNSITRVSFTFELEDGTEYKGTLNEELAELLARDQVKHDLMTEPELFRKEWLQQVMSEEINGESFLDYASKRAVEEDGWQHYLCHYDGCEDYTENNYVFWRVN